jgi:hypothetical protein
MRCNIASTSGAALPPSGTSRNAKMAASISASTTAMRSGVNLPSTPTAPCTLYVAIRRPRVAPSARRAGRQNRPRASMSWADLTRLPGSVRRFPLDISHAFMQRRRLALALPFALGRGLLSSSNEC